MNFLDVLIILTVATLVMVGFFGGVGRVAAGFVAAYLATIIAAAFYEELGDFFIRSVADMREATGYLLAFLLLFIMTTAAFFWTIAHGMKAVQVRRGRLAIMDNVGGATLALVAGALAVAMTLTVAVIILGAFNQSAVAGGGENLGSLGNQIRDSELVPIFLELQEPMVGAFEPWFPNGLPPILQPAPSV